MKDEIKEILDNLKKISEIVYDFKVNSSEIKILLDYITNLQEDNVELRNEVKELERMCELYGKSIYNAELTNLQEELKSANESITWWQNRFNALQKENERLNEDIHYWENKYENTKFTDNDYKSRNEKAIELLKEAGCYDEETKTFCDDVWEELPKLLNILQGDDKE